MRIYLTIMLTLFAVAAFAQFTGRDGIVKIALEGLLGMIILATGVVIWIGDKYL